MRKLLVILGVILALLVATSTLSFAQNELIHGCYQKKKGKLRIVSDPDKCKRSEIPISWNIAGSQGDQGPQGKQGQDGLACWDLDGNRECSYDEDVNEDGVCDALDCQGGPGVQAGGITGVIDFCGEAGPDDGILVYIPGESFMVKTGPDGVFALRAVPPETYDLIVEIPGEAPFTIFDVEVCGGDVTYLGTINYCPVAYYTESDSDGQATLETVKSILIDGKVNTGHINLGPGRDAESIGFDFGICQYVSKIRMYGDYDNWSNFSVLYNTENKDYGWNEVTGLTVTKYKESGGLGGKFTNELSFDPVLARWWKVWSGSGGANDVISVYEFEAWGSQF